MFAFSLIVFREVLEVSLVLGLLVAATRGVPGRLPWILFGMSAGIVGSLILAACTESISQAAQGMGQEIFNASVLLLAALMISWTVVWMKRNARVFAQSLKHAGQEIVQGNKPLSFLALLTGLTVLREGSEIVLLGQGILASGKNISGMFLGGLIGAFAAGVLGLLLYSGLLRGAPRRIFQVCTILMSFLAAGMVAQALGFFSAAGLVSPIIEPIWDSSGILSERSWIGYLLNILVGYIARPSATQIIAYLCSLFLIWASLRLFGQVQSDSKIQFPIKQGSISSSAFGIVLSVLVGMSWATSSYGIDKIYSPNVDYRELEFEYRGRYASDHRGEKDDDSKQLVSVGYAPFERYATEVYGIIENSGEAGEGAEFEAVEWENRFQLFEQGEYWVDSGLYGAFEYDRVARVWEFEGQILLEKVIAPKFVVTGNVLAESEVFHSGGEWEYGSAFKARYLLSRLVEPGIEFHSEYGEADELGSWDDQEHALGPAIYGQLSRHWKYEFADLFGISDAAADNTIRVMLEWETVL